MILDLADNSELSPNSPLNDSSISHWSIISYTSSPWEVLSNLSEYNDSSPVSKTSHNGSLSPPRFQSYHSESTQSSKIHKSFSENVIKLGNLVKVPSTQSLHSTPVNSSGLKINLRDKDYFAWKLDETYVF